MRRSAALIDEEAIWILRRKWCTICIGITLRIWFSNTPWVLSGLEQYVFGFPHGGIFQRVGVIRLRLYSDFWRICASNALEFDWCILSSTTLKRKQTNAISYCVVSQPTPYKQNTHGTTCHEVRISFQLFGSSKLKLALLWTFVLIGLIPSTKAYFSWIFLSELLFW